ncbi:Soluble lytic murein transglycosylase precursor [Jannaschia seosinensis]|uniref:Soluble lytic murein transglycosylase n=1 Tax=Jannaschia seosinensis TaxID=313367 RepID=A0A0M7B6F2_9RHOB|nr:lytic transglycosylase domain-containing protein [Jannaschia seosinensis]CUH08498.1 Soluble lytic murein transglycosylase precursor [Jannaschia seosinensis]
MRYAIAAALLGLLAWTAPVPPAMAADFTFKKLRPPAAGTSRRINIQIEPPPPAAAPQPSDTADAALPPAPQDRRSEVQAWFWSAISPSIERQPGRFLQAARVVARPPSGSGITAPPLAHLQAIARLHGTDILARSVGTRVSPALVLALIAVESAGRADAVSHKGATGLMQLIPATAARFGVTDSRDPSQNIRGGVAYLDWLMGEFGDDPVLALAGYNAGEGAVRRYGGVPPYAETRAYVPKVLAAWNVARLMCRTPPELPGDGCVFEASLTES